MSFGALLAGDALDLVLVDGSSLADAVGEDLVQPPREVDLHAVREVAAVVELHAQDAVPGVSSAW